MAAGILLSFVFSSFAGSPTSWVSEYSFSVDGLYYNILNNREVEVTYMRRSNDSYCPYEDYNFDRDLQVCNIPESVTYNNHTYSVVRIGYAAFCEYFALTSVTIPNSVTTIEQGAFAACRELTSITMSSSVVNISQNLFYLPTCYGGDFPECTNLTDIYVPYGELERFRQMIPSNYQSCVKYVSIPITVTLLAENGMVENLNEEGDSTALLSATPNTGYHFIQWSDGDLNNPRTVQLTQDTSFTAEFAKNTYTITATSNNTVYGIATGGATVEYLDELTLTAVPQTGHHFEYWKSGSTMFSTNPLTITVSDNANYTAYFAPNVYSLTTISDLSQGYVTAPSQAEFLEEVIMTATPLAGYEFVQWGDGVKDNPRYVQLTQDTIFTAEFAKAKYTITTTVNDNTRGTTSGDAEVEYLTPLQLIATANYGYHFDYWKFGSKTYTANPLSITVTGNATYTAYFAPNTYIINVNSDNNSLGSVSALTQANYLNTIILTAIPTAGCRFVQWSDGDTNNPRSFILTQDTAFTAEFAIEKSGACGENNALTWSYDDQSKTLTITGNGALNSNYTFGVEAPTQMQKLVIGNEITSIGDSAFYGMSTINHLIIGGSVATIGNYAFAECRNFDDITCYATIVPVINETTFANVGNKQYIYLFVPEERERAYHRDTYWGEFDIQVQQAEETTVTTNDVTVEPQDNAATVTWPTNDNAASYTIEITKDGVLFCTLTFNANGQLTGIAFAPSHDGHAHAPAAIMTANGLQFTVTGLNSNTQYGYCITTKDSNDQPIATYSGEFTTTGEIATGIDNIQGNEVQSKKFVRNGQILILRGDRTYTLTGQEVR